MKNNHKKVNLYFIFVLAALLLSGIASSQERTEIKLTSILETTENNHNVRFSYATKDVEGVYLIPPDEALTITQIINYLNSNTSLVFEFIDSRYITITPKQAAKITICGTVYHSDDLMPLGGATVQVDNTSNATITDFDGNFTLKNVPENAVIIIRHLGAREERVQVSLLTSSTPCKTLFLQTEIGQLSEVVLQDLFARGINKTAEGSFTFNTEIIGILPGLTEPDVLQMIQVLPGVTSVDETISNINIRGGTNDENLILWDDIRMYQTGHFFGLISAFNPNLTKNVKVYKNGTNARYGENVSGVVAMYSDKNIPTEFSGGINMNLINVGAFFSIPVSDNIGMEISARRSLTDVFKTPAYNQFYNRVFQDTEITNLSDNTTTSGNVSAEENFSFYDFSLKTIYQPTDKDTYTLNFLTIDNALAFTETYTTPASEPTSKTSTLDQKSMAGGVSWNRNWNSSLSSNAMFYGTLYELDATNLDVFSIQAFYQTNKVEETGAKLDATYIFSDNFTLTGGYQFTESGISNTHDINLPRFRNFIKEVLRNHSLFASGAFKLNDNKTNITAGLRTNYFQKFEKLLVEPRLAVHQKLDGGFALEGAAEIKSQTVTQRIDFQNDFLGVEKRRWVLSNDDNVPILTSKQVSLGGLYKQDNWLFNLEGFIKSVDGITTPNQGFQNQFQYERAIGKYDVSGVELTVNKKTRHFSTWFSYTYLKNEYTFDDLEPTTFSHNTDIRHQVSGAVTYTLNNFKLATGLNWHSGLPFTVPQEGNEVTIVNGFPEINYDFPNMERQDSYYRLDVSGEYSFKLSNKVNAKVNAAILNVTNRKNVLNTYFITETDLDGNTSVTRVEQVSLGITPNISLQILF